MKQNPNIFFFSHAVGTFNLEDEMKGLTEELIGLSLDLEKNKKTGVIKSNIGGYQTDLLKKSNIIIKKKRIGTSDNLISANKISFYNLNKIVRR